MDTIADKMANKKAVEVATRMLRENVDINFISTVTGLPTDEILKLKSKTKITN